MAIIADVFSFFMRTSKIRTSFFLHPHICTSTHSHIIFHTYYLSTNAVIWGIFRTFEGYCFYHI